MKIFQVITVSEYGGAQTVVANIAQGLSKDHEVFILYGGNGEAWSHLGDNIHYLKISEHRKKISWKDFFLAFKLFYLRLKHRPDIVHLHSSKMGVLGRIVFNPKRNVLTMHGVDSVKKGFSKFLILEKRLKNRAAKIIAVSQYDVEGLQEIGISDNVELVYNGVIDHTLEKSQSKADINIINKFNTLKDSYSKIIVCISRISKQKKFDLFLEIAKQMPAYAFVWLGNKDEMRNLPDNVYCLGETNSAYLYLEHADVFILPSNYEGLPMSILEALSYGVPVVASAVGGISEILNGENGFAVNNSVDSFVEKINYTLQDNIHPIMQKNARNSYLNQFTIDKMVDGYASIFQKIYNKNHNK